MFRFVSFAQSLPWLGREPGGYLLFHHPHFVYMMTSRLSPSAELQAPRCMDMGLRAEKGLSLNPSRECFSKFQDYLVPCQKLRTRFFNDPVVLPFRAVLYDNQKPHSSRDDAIWEQPLRIFSSEPTALPIHRSSAAYEGMSVLLDGNARSSMRSVLIEEASNRTAFKSNLDRQYVAVEYIRSPTTQRPGQP